MKNLIILIPPSEGKTSGGTHPALGKVSVHSEHIIDQWKDFSTQQWNKYLGLKDKALLKAIEANKDVLSSKTLPAIERYSGVVYSAIDYPTLSKKAKSFFDQHVQIVSGLFGLVKPQDLIPDYKWKIDSAGADKFWRPINRKKLEGAFIVDVLPQAHKKAVEHDKGAIVDFYVIKNGQKMPAGHQGKHIKGRFIRWLVERQTVDEKAFQLFNEDGFKWTGKAFVKSVK